MTCNTANKNYLQASKFQLQFDRLPDVSFFCKRANIPGISVPGNMRPTPFTDLQVPGDKVIFETFDVYFAINETLSPWKEIFEWMIGMGFPENFDQYANLKNLRPQQLMAALKDNNITPQYSDGQLSVYSNKNNPLVKVKYVDCFPTFLSSIDLDVEATADEIVIGRASFIYSYYTFII